MIDLTILCSINLIVIQYVTNYLTLHSFDDLTIRYLLIGSCLLEIKNLFNTNVKQINASSCAKKHPDTYRRIRSKPETQNAKPEINIYRQARTLVTFKNN